MMFVADPLPFSRRCCGAAAIAGLLPSRLWLRRREGSQGAALMLVLADGRDVVVEGGHASTLFPAAGFAAIIEEVPCFNPPLKSVVDCVLGSYVIPIVYD